jgi:hypothetical protein
LVTDFLAMEHELPLRIVVQDPPAGVDFGLQEGRGSNYQTVQRQRSAAKDLQFDFSVRAKLARAGAAPILLGSFVQGPPAGRFVYIDIGTYAGQTGTEWSRRLKVPLKGITASLVNNVKDDPRLVLEARVPGALPDGSPNCRTPKAVEWILSRR